MQRTQKLKAIIFSQIKEFDFWLLLFMFGISNSVFSIKLITIFGSFLFLIIKNKALFIESIKNPKVGLHYFWKDKTNLFFLSLIAIALINLFLEFSRDYFLVVLVGIFFWICNLLIHANSTYFTTKLSYSKVIKTLQLFVCINFLFSLLDLLQVILATRSLLPYTQIAPPPFGVMSGDLIQGLFAPEHLPNGIISTFLFLFLFLKKHYKTSFLALTTVLLESSNLSALIICFFLLVIFILNDKAVKYRVLIFFAFILVFYMKINPSNFYDTLKIIKVVETNKFVENITKETNAKQNEIQKEYDDLKRLENEWNKVNNEHRIFTYLKNDSSRTKLSILFEKNLDKKTLINKLRLDSQWKKLDSINEINRNNYQSKNLKEFNLKETPGVLIALKQTANQLTEGPKKLLIGSGAGNSSSYLAIMSSKTIENSRLFDLILPKHEHADFLNNNGVLWMYVNSRGEEYHSVVHYPYNTYNTLLGEYGIIGFLAFLLLYILPKIVLFIKQKQTKIMLILIPLFLILVGTFYWFESFILIMFFEIIIHNELNKERNGNV